MVAEFELALTAQETDLLLELSVAGVARPQFEFLRALIHLLDNQFLQVAQLSAVASPDEISQDIVQGLLGLLQLSFSPLLCRDCNGVDVHSGDWRVALVRDLLLHFRRFLCGVRLTKWLLLLLLLERLGR